MTPTTNAGSQVVQLAAERARQLARSVANRIGSPIDAQAPTQSEQVRLWNYQDPKADPAQVQALVDAGQHSQAIDMLYPWRTKLMGNGPLGERVANAERLSAAAARTQEGDGTDAGT